MWLADRFRRVVHPRSVAGAATIANQQRKDTASMENKSKDGVFMFVISSSDIREKSNDAIAKEIEEAWSDDDGVAS